VHTVVETPAYLSSAKNAGMTEAERVAAVDAVALDPTLGDLIVGAGGCRKFRLAGRGKGKSGGYRVISCFVDEGDARLSSGGLFQGRPSRPFRRGTPRSRQVGADSARGQGMRKEG